MTTLTKLDLAFSNRPNPEKHTKLDAVILEVFKICHRLEDISISCNDPLRGISEPATDDPIHLPSLQFLRLDLMTFDTTFILQSIATPKKMSVVAITGRLNKCPKKADCLIGLRTDPRGLSCLTHMYKLYIDIKRCSIHRWMMDGNEDYFNSSVHFVVHEFDGNHSDTHSREAIVATLGLIQRYYIMPQLTELHIEDTHDKCLSTEEFILFLCHSPLLTRLTISGCSPDFLAKLAIHWSYSALPLCPQLGYVELNSMTILLSTLKEFCIVYFAEPEYRLLTHKLKRSRKGCNRPNNSICLSHDVQTKR